MKNFLRNFFNTSIGTLISKISGYIRDVFIAKYLGSGYYTDIFFMAFKIPNFFRKITAEGAMNSAFVPIFSSGLRQHSKTKMLCFARNIFSILMYSLVILVIVAEFFMPEIITLLAPGFDSGKKTLTILLARITFPYLIFISLVALMSGILNTFNKFFLVSIIPLIMNLTIITFILFSRNLPQSGVALFASFGVIFSGLFQFAFTMYFLIKEKVFLFSIKPHFLSYQTKKFLRKFFHIFLAGSIIQINSIVNSMIVSPIAGAVSFLYYSDRITQFPLSIIGVAISVSILPSLSSSLSKNEYIEESQALQESSFFWALFFGLPSAVGLFTLSTPMISFFFERGEFTVFDTISVANLVKIYSFAVPFFIFSKILNSIFYAKKDVKTPCYISLINFFINVTCSFFSSKYFGVLGVASSFVLSTIITTILMFFKLVKDRTFIITDFIYLKSLKILYISLVMGIVIVCSRDILGFFDANDFLKLLIGGGIGFAFYMIASQFIGILNMREIISFLKK
jgi:putative peptidoglycan lipid II flippase